MTSNRHSLRPAVFLDRDGVIIENREDYVKSWDEVALLPGALEALARLASSPFAVIIVTNQSAVGRGRLSPEGLEEINARLLAAISSAGGRVDAVYCCPHSPADHCACRKPEPGMLLRAAEELNLDLGSSYMVGDAASDIEAGLRAGAAPILVFTGRGRAQQAKCPPCAAAADLGAAVDIILK